MRALRGGRLALASGLMLLVSSVISTSAAQGVPLAPGTTLFALDLSTTEVGEFPTSISLLNGLLQVALRNGTKMLKASSQSEFLVRLPQALPRDFTIEFDVVPHPSGNLPQDLSFEGTSTINQGPISAHVLWQANGSLVVIGGGGAPYDTPMPEGMRSALPGTLTHVVADFQGTTLKLYTNGQRMYTLTKEFVRGRVLRVLLGGHNDAEEAVYLAGLRISARSGLGILAAEAGLPAGSTARPPATGAATGAKDAPTTTGATAPATPPAPPSALPAAPPIATSTPSPTPSNPSPPNSSAPTTGASPRPVPPGQNPTGTSNASRFGPPQSRIVSLSPFSAAGVVTMPLSRVISLTAFTAAGTVVSSRRASPGSAPPTSRTISLPTYNASGVLVILPSRTITLPAFTAAGVP